MAQRNFENLQKLNNTGFKSLETDLYSILNVSTEATQKEIRKAYHKLELQIHDDKKTQRNFVPLNDNNQTEEQRKEKERLAELEKVRLADLRDRI